MNSPKVNYLVYASGLFWLLALLAGTAVFWQYENKAGAAALAPSDWPAKSTLQRVPDRPTLVLLAHPRCPCTRTSIHELARLMARADGRVMAYVIFIKPDGTEADWERSDTWSRASEIPGVSVIRDDQGLEAQNFDARSSGQTMLYDKDGKLIFSGGITSGRGEEGDNSGETTIASLVNNEKALVHETSVFGCPLFAHDPYCMANKEAANERSDR